MSQDTSAATEVEEILADKFGIIADDYDDRMPLGAEGLDLDSLGMVEMAEIVDARLGVSITDEELATVNTVGDLKEMIGSKI